MGRFEVGQIVSCAFPFSDLASRKMRPALIVAIVDFDDVILCQITSKPYSSSGSITLLATDFTQGKLPVVSYIRPDKLFTAEPSIISKTYGVIHSNKLKAVRRAIRDIFAS